MLTLLQGMGTLISGGWQMLTGINVPGLNFSFAALLVGITLVDIGLKFLSHVLGFGFGGAGMVGYFTSGDANAAAAYRHSRNEKAQISKERQNDER